MTGATYFVKLLSMSILLIHLLRDLYQLEVHDCIYTVGLNFLFLWHSSLACVRLSYNSANGHLQDSIYLFH